VRLSPILSHLLFCLCFSVLIPEGDLFLSLFLLLLFLFVIPEGDLLLLFWLSSFAAGGGPASAFAFIVATKSSESKPLF
jgi:hypothetical protein